MAAPRAVIQTALDDPKVYLESPDLPSSAGEGSIAASLPDLSVAYKLQGECGRLVNLYDWMQVGPFLLYYCCQLVIDPGKWQQ